VTEGQADGEGVEAGESGKSVLKQMKLVHARLIQGNHVFNTIQSICTILDAMLHLDLAFDLKMMPTAPPSSPCPTKLKLTSSHAMSPTPSVHCGVNPPCSAPVSSRSTIPLCTTSMRLSARHPCLPISPPTRTSSAVP